MKVLVTGHDGYVGSVLAPALRAAGHHVTGLDAYYFARCTFGVRRAVPARPLDVRDVRARDLEGLDAVVHLAALSNDPLGDLDVEWTRSINRDATRALAHAAAKAGVRRFVFASSCAMYGAVVDGAGLAETAPLRPLTTYAESKVAGESALWELATTRFTPVAMRTATVYGVSLRLRLDVVLNNLVAWAHTTGEIRLQSDGASWRPLIHVRDVARAATALLEAPDELVGGEAFNIGSNDQNYRIRDLADRVQERLPRCRVTFTDDSAPDPRSYRVDFTKFESTFPAARPRWTAERGVDELTRAFARVGLDAGELPAGRYTRLYELKRLLETGALDEQLRWAGSGLRGSTAPEPGISSHAASCRT